MITKLFSIYIRDALDRKPSFDFSDLFYFSYLTFCIIRLFYHFFQLQRLCGNKCTLSIRAIVRKLIRDAISFYTVCGSYTRDLIAPWNTCKM